MLHHLTGRIVKKTPTEVILDVGGVGYEVSIPVSTYGALPGGGEATLLVRSVTRNEETRIYGFASEAEREVFRMVTAVQGVGPSSALSLLSALSPGEFRLAVAEKDVAALQRTKGIGKKTAARIATELEDKVAALPLNGEGAGEGAGGGAGTVGGPVGRLQTAVAALVNLGFGSGEARRVVDRVVKKLPDGASVEEVIREALRASAR